MSLFGEDDAPARSKSTGLFDEEPKSDRKTGSSLFADEPSGGNDSPWDFPTPKKAARGNPVKSLLPATDVPESYIDAFDTLIATGNGQGNSVNTEAVKKLLVDSGINAGSRSNILEIVTRGQPLEQLGRNEFNVLLALSGLALEGEDVTLDSVDERRRNLPEPALRLPKNTSSELSQAQAHTRSSSTPVRQPEQQQTMRKQSFGFPDTDPWASPALHKGHNHAETIREDQRDRLSSSNAGNAPVRTTSSFTTHGEQQNTSLPNDRSTTRPTSNGGWGSYDSSGNTGFSGPSLGGQDFGTTGGNDGNGPPGPGDLGASLGGSTRIATSSGVEEVVTVTSLSEKEGMFLFQHRNYQVTSARRNSKVVRRYSDFVWLLDCLQKRYPFRQLPLLPPKRVAINGNHLAADASFIEKRRKGLARFVNSLVRHPVLSQEQLVVMFLTVPTELAVWRKQATISVQEEFVGKSLPPGLEDSLSPTLEELFEQTRSGIRRSAEIYINLCNLTERLTKRSEGLAADYGRLSTALTTLTEASADTYATDTNDVPLLNEGLLSSAKHFSSSQALLEDEARGSDEGALEDLKRQRDSLVSMRELFDRRDRVRDNIPQLEKRIESNEAKLAGIRAKPENLQKPGEAEKVEDAIVKDKQSIVEQHARGVFIKECVRDEIIFFSKSQYHVSRLHQDWSQERVKYAELQADNWRALSEEVENMPLGD